MALVKYRMTRTTVEECIVEVPDTRGKVAMAIHVFRKAVRRVSIEGLWRYAQPVEYHFERVADDS